MDFLHLAEFSYNNFVHSSTRYSPFFTNTGYHPRWLILKCLEVTKNPTVEDRLHLLQDVQAKLSVHLRNAQAAHKKATDKHRLDSSPEEPKFRIRDHVWLLRRNVKTTRPWDKLDFQCLGPFVISSQVNDVAFRLDLPSHMRLHPVFQVSLLEPYTSSSIPNRSIPPT